MTPAIVYLRLSDLRNEEALDGREAKLRAEAARLDWTVVRVVIENDATPAGTGRSRPASAFKRRKITTPSGEVQYRVIRPGFRSAIGDLMAGRARALLAEDLDRVARDPRDLEDLIDCVERRGAVARSLTGNIRLDSSDGIAMARVLVAMGSKSSADTGRRVAATRERLAGTGTYGGGIRPYGFRPDPESVKYHRTLLVVPGESAILRRAGDDVLRGVSLASIARDLRDRGEPTVTGAKWTAATLRDVLLKPTIAGLAIHNGTLHPATWPAILERDQWEAVRGKLTDPARRTTPGNAPRWLVSLIARCGRCGDGTTVRATGGRDRVPAYICPEHNHLRRNAVATDAYAAAVMTARLGRDDMADLLRPAPRAGTDTTALRAEAAQLRDRKAAQARMHAAGDLDDDDLKAGAKYIRGRLDAIRVQLAAATDPDPLEEFRDAGDVAAAWAGLGLPRQREIVRLLMTITIMPAGRRGPGFDPETVLIEWRQ